METLLRKQCPDYDNLCKERNTEADKYTQLRAYRHSTRYNKVKSSVDDCLDDNILVSDMYKQMNELTHEFNIPVMRDEINLVLSRHKKDIALVTMNDEQWILPGYEEARSFLGKNKDKLSLEQKYSIMTTFSPYFRKLCGVSGIKHEQMEITYNIQELLEFVSILNLSNTDKDSASETDSDNDIYSSEDEDDDNGLGALNNVVLSISNAVREN